MARWLALTLLATLMIARHSVATDASSLMTGRLLPEGSSPEAPGAFVLAHQTAPLAVDLRQARAFRGILLQADGNDVYFVEVSGDGLTWRILWRVPKVDGLPGLRTRTTVLPAPVTARFLRVRGALGDGGYSVSQLRVYEVLPSPWPPTLDYSVPGSRLPPFPSLTPAVVLAAKNVLGTLALLLLGWSAIAGRLGRTPRSERWRRSLLGAVALLAALSWWNFLNFHYQGFAHNWDVYHYYVGAKYFRELGYTGLYECSAIADLDDGVEQVRDREMRDLVTNEIVPATRVLARPEACRGRFSSVRWASFRHDIGFFRNALGPSQWARSQVDHGFNATPVWILAGGAVTNLGSASATQVNLLASLDVGLLLALWALVAWYFGLEAFCAALVYWSLNSFSRFAWTGGALLRYDWLFWTVVSVCMLRRKRPALAGFAITYASLLRVFPGCLFVGLALKAVGEAALSRRPDPVFKLWRVALGGVAALAILVPSSIALTGRPDAWHEFRENTRRFLTTEADNFIGLAVIASYRPSLREELAWDPMKPDPFADWKASQAEAGRQARPGLWVATLAFAAVVAAASIGREDWVAAVLGMGLVPVALKLAHYYYSWLLLYGLLWSVCPAAGIGVAAMGWVSNGLPDLFPSYDERAVWLSVLVVGFVAFVTSLLAQAPKKVRGGPPATP